MYLFFEVAHINFVICPTNVAYIFVPIGQFHRKDRKLSNKRGRAQVLMTPYRYRAARCCKQLEIELIGVILVKLSWNHLAYL